MENLLVKIATDKTIIDGSMFYEMGHRLIKINSIVIYDATTGDYLMYGIDF